MYLFFGGPHPNWTTQEIQEKPNPLNQKTHKKDIHQLSQW